MRAAVARWSLLAAARRPVGPGAMVNPESRIDRVSRVLFPLAFLLFNVLYWGVLFAAQSAQLSTAAAKAGRSKASN